MKAAKEIGSNLKSYHKVIIGFLIISFLFDFLDKIDVFYGMYFIKFNRYLKFVFIVLSLGFILSKLKFVFAELKIFLLVFISLMTVFLLKNNYSALYINEFLRYGFGLIIFPLIYYTYFKTNIPLARHLYVFFKVFICVNAVAILIGLAFDLSVVKTYQYGRFGYNGMLLSQGVTPYVYLSATALFLSFKDKWMVGLILILSLVSGIKGVYLAEFLLLILFVILNKRYDKRKKIRVGSLTLLCFLVFITILFLNPTFSAVLATDGFLAMLFSFRNENLMDVFHAITSSNYNVFIGVLSLQTVRIEMQFFDIMLFFGLIGFIAYALFIRYLMLRIALTITSKIYLIVAVTLSLLSGNLFYIPMAMLLIFLILFAFKNGKLSIQKQ